MAELDALTIDERIEQLTTVRDRAVAPLAELEPTVEPLFQRMNEAQALYQEDVAL